MRYLMAALAVLAAPASAAVKSSSPAGFETVNTAVVAGTPDQVYTLLTQPARWWDKAHTYSGDSANLSIVAKAGGCFCETTPGGGSVEHGRVVYAQPGKALRLSGALGPLQGEGASGAMTWTLKPVPGGTEVTQTYVIGGYIRGGAAQVAPAVDAVLGEQLNRLKQAAAH